MKVIKKKKVRVKVVKKELKTHPIFLGEENHNYIVKNSTYHFIQKIEHILHIKEVKGEEVFIDKFYTFRHYVEQVPLEKNITEVISKDSHLYKITANHPIQDDLDDDDKYVIANQQVIRYSKGYMNEGDIELDDNNKIQYEVTLLSDSFKEDIDIRTDNPEDYYISTLLKEELDNYIKH